MRFVLIAGGEKSLPLVSFVAVVTAEHSTEAILFMLKRIPEILISFKI